MMESIADSLLFVCSYLLLAAWRAVPLFVLVLAADWLFARRIAARFHCVLWMLVLARFLCPLSVPSDWSIQGRFDAFAQRSVERVDAWFPEPVPDPKPFEFDTYTLDEGGQTITLPFIPADATEEYIQAAEAWVAKQIRASDGAGGNALQASDSSSDRRIHPERSRDPVYGIEPERMTYPEVILFIVLYAWLPVTVTLVARSSVAHWRFMKRVQRSRRVSVPEINARLAVACDRMNVRRVPELRQVEGVFVPAVFGIWRHTICMPCGAVDELKNDDLDWVFMHELAHIKRRDGLVLIGAGLVRATQWFNPFAHLAYAKLRNRIEQAADALAIGRMPGRSSASYGRLLLRYARRTNDRTPDLSIGLLYMSSGKSLKRRIEMLSRNESTNRSRGESDGRLDHRCGRSLRSDRRKVAPG